MTSGGSKSETPFGQGPAFLSLVQVPWFLVLFWHSLFLLQDMNCQLWWHGVSRPLGSSGSHFCNEHVSVSVTVNSALLLFAVCLDPALARVAMGMFAARQSLHNSVVLLLSTVCCHATTEGPQSLLEGLSLFLVVLIPQCFLGLWHCSERDPCFAWHLVLEQISACAVSYGSCEGDINWEACVCVCFHGSVCLLLGEEMAFVVPLNTSLMSWATQAALDFCVCSPTEGDLETTFYLKHQRQVVFDLG